MVGKTTLLDAIFWTLYGYLPKWGGPKGGPADAVIKRGYERCDSTVVIEHAGDVYEFTRQRPIKFIVKKNGTVIEGKVADLEKRLPQMIGMTDSQFLLSIYMPQKRSSSFFNMSDSDRTELLSKVAGLEELDSALVQAKAERNSLNIQSEKLKATIAVRQNMLVRLPAKIEECTTELQKQMKDLQDAIDMDNHIRGDAEDEIKKLESKLSKDLQDILLVTDQEISEHETQLRTLKDKYAEINGDLAQVPRPPAELFTAVENSRHILSENEAHNRLRLSTINTNENLRQKILQELDLMEAASLGKCNHCKQELPASDKEQAAFRHMENAKKHESSIKDVPEEIDLAPFREGLEKAQEELSRAKFELSERPLQLKIQLDSIMKEMKAGQELIDMKRTSARRESDNLRSQAEMATSKIKSELSQSSSKIAGIQKFVDYNLSELQKLEKQQKEEESELDLDKVQLSGAEKNMDLMLDLMDLFGPKGFRTVCFEELIARISDRAGQLLSVMTEGLYSTRIEQAGETGKGEHRVMLRPVITRGGLEVPLDDLSGGAEATITLAYDVAISEAIAENSPLFLDEALDGLDSQGKGEAIRLMEEVGRTRPVFLIDHTNEIKSSVQNVITITYKNDTSSLENSDETDDSTSITG